MHKDSPATDLFHFNIAVSLAQYYSNTTSDNVKRAYEAKIKKGEWIGRAKIGYININENGNKNIIPDPARSHFIPQMFQMRANGSSVRAVMRAVREMGLRGTVNNKPIGLGTIQSILTDTFYYGEMKVKGKLYPHKYEPLISRELFDRCQEVALGWHKKPFKWGSKPYILRGMIKCAFCGCMITPETQKGHIYYHCTNYKEMHDKIIYVREEELLEPIYKILDEIRLPEDKINKITESLRKINESKNSFQKTQITFLNKEYQRLQNRADNLFDLRLDSDGSITTEMFNKKLKEIKEKQAEILEKIQRYSNADEKFYLTANMMLNLAKRAKEVFIGSEVDHKRQILNFLLQNLILDGKRLKFELKTPFNWVLEANKCSDMCARRDSNLQPLA